MKALGEVANSYHIANNRYMRNGAELDYPMRLKLNGRPYRKMGLFGGMLSDYQPEYINVTTKDAIIRGLKIQREPKLIPDSIRGYVLSRRTRSIHDLVLIRGTDRDGKFIMGSIPGEAFLLNANPEDTNTNKEMKSKLDSEFARLRLIKLVKR